MTTSVPLHDAAELTRYIEERYHVRLRAQLPELAALSAKVEQVHAGRPGVPTGLTDILTRMIGEMEVHMKKEELILFPAIRNGAGPVLGQPIAAMRHDHVGHIEDARTILGLTQNLTLPENACRTWTSLYDGLGVLVRDLEEHLRLENEVLFPQFEATDRMQG
jgi:regulator of cell morphogenesis and NO signaling